MLQGAWLFAVWATLLFGSVSSTPSVSSYILGNITGYVGSRVFFDAGRFFSDIPQATLTFSIQGLPIDSGMTMNPSNGVLQGVPLPVDQARRTCLVHCSSSFGGSAQGTLYIYIKPVNRPPILLRSIDPVSTAVYGGSPLAIYLNNYFMDQDPDDTLTFSVQGLPPGTGFVFNSQNAILSGTPNQVDLASQPLTVQLVATDSSYTSASTKFTINVQQGYRAPTCTTVPPVNARVGDLLSASLKSYCQDLDGGTLTFSVIGLPTGSGLSINASGVLKGLPLQLDLDRQPIPLSLVATNPRYLQASSPFMLNIQPANKPPVASQLAPAQAIQGQAFSLDLRNRFVDPEAEPLNFYLGGGVPIGSGLKMNSGVVSGIPSWADCAATPQPLRLIVIVSDGHTNGNISSLLMLGVQCANQPPVAIPIPAPSRAEAGKRFLFRAAPYFTSPDGDPLTYTIDVPMGSGFVIDSAMGVVAGTPTNTDCWRPQPVQLGVTARDNRGGSANTVLTIQISCGVAQIRVSGLPPALTVSYGKYFEMNLANYVSTTGPFALQFQTNSIPPSAPIFLSREGLLAGTPGIRECDLQFFGVDVAVDDAHGAFATASVFVAVDCSSAPRGPPVVLVGVPVGVSGAVGVPARMPAGVSLVGVPVASPFAASLWPTISLTREPTPAPPTPFPSYASAVPWSWAPSPPTSRKPTMTFYPTPEPTPLPTPFPNPYPTPRPTSYPTPYPSLEPSPKSIEDNYVLPEMSLGTPVYTLQAQEFAAINLEDIFDFPSSNALRYSVKGLKTNKLSLNTKTGVLSGTPSTSDCDNSPMGLLATASVNTQLTQSRVLVVQVLCGENADWTIESIVAFPIPDQSAGEGFFMDLSQYFYYDGANSLSYDVQGLPVGSGLNFFGDGSIRGQPSQNDCRATQPIELTVSVDDGMGQQASSKFLLRAVGCDDLIDTMNLSPLASSIPALVAKLNQLAFVQVSNFFSDPNGDTLTFRVVGLPAGSGLQLGPTGVLSGQPSQADADATKDSPLTLRVFADDGRGGQAQGTLLFRVQAGVNGNSGKDNDVQITTSSKTTIPPTPKVLPSSFEMNLGESQSIELSSYVDCGDDAAFFSNNLPADSGLALDPVTGELAGTPTDAALRASPIKVSLVIYGDDPACSNSDYSFMVIVRNNQQGPKPPNSPSRTPDVLRSCEELGWTFPTTQKVCGFSRVAKGNCTGDVTYVQALQICALISARLCTSPELSVGAGSGTGCGLDQRRIWSSSPCSTKNGNGVFTQAGSDNKDPASGALCSAKEERYPVRCCADSRTRQRSSAPLVSRIPDLSIDAGQQFSRDLGRYFSDPDGDVLGFTIVGQTSADQKWLRFDARTAILSGTPPVDSVDRVLNLRVTGNDGRGGSVDASFSLTVQRKPNPNTNAIPPATFFEGVPALMGVSSFFQDEDSLLYSLSGLPARSGLRIDPDLGVISGTPNLNDVQASPMSLRVSAQDSVGQRAETTMKLTIRPGKSVANRPPTAMGISDSKATVGVPFLTDLSARFLDPDQDSLAFSIQGLPVGSGLVVSSSGVFGGVPTKSDQNGSPIKLLVQASDRKGGMAEASFKLTVTANALVNSPPVRLQDLPALRISDGIVKLDAGQYFVDSDNDPLRFSLVGLPQASGISIDPNTGVISGSPTQQDLECHQPLLAGVVADDGRSQSGALISIFLGQAIARRDASGKSTSSCENLQWMTIIPGSGVCAQSYLSSPQDCPDRMSFAAAALTCASSGARLCTVSEIQRDLAKGSGCALDVERVWAADECAGGHMSIAGAASSLNDVPSICTVNRMSQFMRCCADSSTVSAGEAPPSQCLDMAEQSTLHAKAGKWSFFGIGAAAGNNDLRLQGLPPNSGMVFYPQYRAIAGTPVLDDALASPMVLTLFYTTDSQSRTILYTLLVDSTSPPSLIDSAGNRLPVTIPLPAATAFVGQLFTYDARPSCSDPDGDALTFSLEGMPSESGFRIIPSSGVIFGAPSLWDVSASQPLGLTVGCSDGKGRTNQTFAIRVSASQSQNKAPMAGSLPPISGRVGQYLSVDLSSGFWDPQGRQLTFTQAGLPSSSGLSLSKLGFLTGTPNANDRLASRAQPVIVTITADIKGAKAQTSVAISIDQGKSSSGPSASPMPDRTVTLGEPFFVDFSSQFQASNWSDLTFQLSGLPSESGLSFNSDLITLSGIPSDADMAQGGPMLTPLTISVTAADSLQQSATSTLLLTVVPNLPTQSSKMCSVLRWNSTTPLLCATSYVPSVNVNQDAFDLTRTQCSGLVSFYQAALRCEVMGGRLCTADELANDATKNTGCNLDSKIVWSSTPCSQGDGVMTRPGSSTGKQQCSQKDLMFNARCCADKKKNLVPPTVLPIFGVVADVGIPLTVPLGRNFIGMGLTFQVNGLPDGTGLKLDPQTGKLYGSPTTVDAAATQPLRLVITATDAAGNTAQGTLLLTVGQSAIVQDKSRSAKTCQELGWNTSKSDTLCGNSAPTGRCQPPVTYSEADLICTRVGARLCTQNELSADVASDTGCMLDEERTWSSTQCDSESPPDAARREFSNFVPSDDDDYYLLLALGGERRVFMDEPPGLIMTQSGGSKFSKQYPARCESTETLKYRVRCCADATLAPIQPTMGIKLLIPQTAAVLVPGAKFNLDLSTKFSSSRPLQYAITGLPNKPGLTFNANTGILSGTPSNALLAKVPLTLIVNASDPKGRSAQTRLSLTVRSDAPTPSPSPAPTTRGKVAKPSTRPTRGKSPLTKQPTPEPTFQPTPQPTPQPTSSPTPLPPTLPPTINASAPQSCSSLGWSVRQQTPTICAESLIYRGECSPLVGVLVAPKMCNEKLGARLCTSAELRLGLISGDPCNSVNVWSSTPCADGLIAVLGLPDNLSETCGTTQSRFSALCCSDVPPGNEFRNFNVDRSAGITISWSWGEYPTVRVSYQKTSEPQGSWITPLGAERVTSSKYTFPQLSPNTDYVVRLTPLRQGQPVSSQEVQLMFHTS